MTAAVLNSPAVAAANAIVEQQRGRDVSQCDAAALSSAAVTPAASSEKPAADSDVHDDVHDDVRDDVHSVPTSAAAESVLVSPMISSFMLCCRMSCFYGLYLLLYTPL
jgi:hypothetical protein